VSSSELDVGPCEPWTDGAEVAACCPADIGSEDPDLVYANAIIASSEFLYELSGHRFSGLCEQRVRPCADGCSCWDYILSPAQAPSIPWGWGWWGYGWSWGWEGCGAQDGCGCGTLSRALLPGYPVRSITQVVIGDEVLDSSEYRLDQNRWLTRLWSAEGNAQFWPSCQNLGLDIGEPGTWYVDYVTGQEVPQLAQDAATQLACQLFLFCNGDASGACLIPNGVTKEVRQGVTFERQPFIAWGMLNGQWATGLSQVDMFLSAYNPAGIRQQPNVWSPDLPGYGLRVPGP
jgi:hypothetical protein